jgi:single-strand DNA-binding protein
VDGETTFLRGAAWESLGENVASLPSGTRVNVTGILRSRTYDTKDGEKRTVLEATFETVSPDLRFATVKVTKASRGGGSAAPAEADPWTGEAATLTPEQYQARMQTLRDSLGATPVQPAL